MIHDHSKLLMIWAGMMQRCYDEDHPQHLDYGGRGIMVSLEWHDFRVFAEDMSPRPEGLSLDRIDNDSGYSKSNCRWATHEEQARNRRSCVYLTVDGETKTAAEWSQVSGFSASAIIWRHNQGWPDKEAVFGPSKSWHKRKPPGRQGSLVALNGEAKTMSEWKKATGLSRYKINKLIHARSE